MRVIHPIFKIVFIVGPFILWSASIKTQTNEWITPSFPGSTVIDIHDVDGRHYASVSNGELLEYIPEINYQLSIYEVHIENTDEPGIMVEEVTTLPFQEKYSTFSIEYVDETKHWIAVQSAYISQGRQLYRTILLDSSFNIISEKVLDTLGYPIAFHIDSYPKGSYILGSVLGPPNHQLFYQKIYHKDSSILQPISITQTNPQPTFWVTSMSVDTMTGDILIFYYDGMAVLDSNLFQKKVLFDHQIKTSDHGSVLALNPNYYSHGASHQDNSNSIRWNVLHKYDTSFNILFADTFGIVGKDNYPFIYKSIDHRNNEFAVGGHLDGPINHFDFYRSIKKFYLAKYDEDMNQLWYKEYGGDKAYWFSGIYLLDDGGVLAYGFITDTFDNYRYAYIMHVDANGEIQSTSTIPPRPETSIRIINPGRETLRLLNPDDIDARIVLFDLHGRELWNREIDGTEAEYPTQDIPAGVYPYTLISEGKVIGAGKWVKAD